MIKSRIQSTKELSELLEISFGISLDSLIKSPLISVAGDAYISGSLIDGFWNEKSDIDIYAFSDNPLSYDLCYDLGPNLPRARRKLVPDLQRVEVTYLPQNFDSVYGAYFDNYLTQESAPMALGPEAMEILHRFSTGVPLAAHGTFADRQARINRGALQQYFADVHLRRADSYLEDVVGALAEDDLINATTLTRCRIECVADSLLAQLGETNTRVEKWRWKKIARAFGVESDLWRSLYAITFPAVQKLSKSDIRTSLANANAFLTSQIGDLEGAA
ncbi:hypothetical protein BC777_1781 [Yoonia maricola]|uniref:Nucleotidyltransferase-like protein n=2 Tax=Yoonia maricola TaxID=420999 RepID=A0A2M8WQ01_9RHOB|nr:hypothetical protein BC777_1781 [Yoonia maricola]